MSIYTVQEVAYRALHDRDFRAELLRAPEEALAGEDLTAEERSALLAGDVATLYRMGAHEYLLWHFSRFGIFGLDQKMFSDRIRSVARTQACGSS